jgi:hypothetical protein
MVRREKFANGTPEPKPERTFADKLRTLKEVSKGISPESRLRLLDYFIQEALEKNQITKDQASGIYDQLQQDKDKIRDQIDAYDRVNFSEGSKDEQRKIADDEYYASLQKIIERDPAAKKFFNPDDITYPAMDKSGEYNYRGVQVQTDDLDFFKRYAKRRGLDQILSPESTFERKIEKGQFPIGLYTEPVQTGSEPGDLDKISTMLHEVRHKVLMNPEFSKIIDQYGLDEEIFVRYLDKEFFPELEQELTPPTYRKISKEDQKYFDKAYGYAVKDYKKKFKRDDLKEKFVAKVKSLFADGGRAGFKDGRKPMPSGENLTDAQKAGYARRFNYQKAAKDANFKKLVDNIFKTEDFGNFKAKVTDAQIRAAERAGKVRKGTGIIPAQYIAQFNKAIEAGVDSPEFKEILKITGRSEDEILELNSKRPGGKVVFDVRSKAAEESFPEERKLTEAQKTEKQKKIKAKRGDRLEITTGKAKYLKGSDKFPFHHIMNIGGEIPLTTNDIAIVTKEMNSRLAPYNTKLNDIADGIRENTKLAFEAAFSKNEADSLKYLKRVDQLNDNAEQIVKKAVKELPKEYKQLIGFNKAYPVTNEYGLPIDDKLRVERVGGVDTKVRGKNLADLTSEEITALKKKISADIEVGERGILSKLGKGAKVVGKVFKPLGYVLGTGAVFTANALAEERGIDLKPIDYVFAMESGDAEVALDNAKRRIDPEYAAAQRAKDLGRLSDDFEEIGKSTFGKYNDQIKNIKLS